MVVLAEDQFIKYFVDKNFSINDSDFSDLCEMDFVMEDEFDGLAYLENLRKTVVNSKKNSGHHNSTYYGL